ncbi:MAG TPA: nucleotidyltransferase family protein [Nitrososphaerales archaeon]|nr:nucleotidyltransferase family protein [Nitrososphaerales archaeon]
MKAILLSGGQGLRMRPLTEDKPKPLVPVNGRPIAELQIEWLTKESGVDCVVFACGYKWERLREHFGEKFRGVNIEYSVEETTLGTGGAIRKAMSSFPDETFVVANGDIVTGLPLQKMIDAHAANAGAAATMLVVPYKSRFGVVRIDKLKTVRGFEEKPEFPDVWINGGAYVLSSKKTMKYLPDKGDIERESFPKMVAHGDLMSYPYYGDWWYIDSIKDLKEVEVAMSSPA